MKRKPTFTIVLIDNGKKPNEILNARLFIISLPSSSPFGNLLLKHLKIIQRLDEANRKIASSFETWALLVKSIKDKADPPPLSITSHHFTNEEAIYHIRRASDEIIALIFLLNEFLKKNEYPNAIAVDSIGAALNYNERTQQIPLIQKHKNVLQLLNEISNAFKHSFINSDLNYMIGRNEPCIQALSLNHNKLSSTEQFYSVSLNELISAYNNFYVDAINWLKEFSKNRHK